MGPSSLWISPYQILSSGINASQHPMSIPTGLMELPIILQRYIDDSDIWNSLPLRFVPLASCVHILYEYCTVATTCTQDIRGVQTITCTVARLIYPSAVPARVIHLEVLNSVRLTYSYLFRDASVKLYLVPERSCGPMSGVRAQGTPDAAAGVTRPMSTRIQWPSGLAKFVIFGKTVLFYRTSGRDCRIAERCKSQKASQHEYRYEYFILQDLEEHLVCSIPA